MNPDGATNPLASAELASPGRRRVLTRGLGALAGATLLARQWVARASEAASTVAIELFSAAGKSQGVAQLAKVVKSEAEWRSQLSPAAFQVTRHEGTELAFSGAYASNHDDGLYRCVCCDTALYDSKTKFESGTGWPSFWQPISRYNVQKSTDRTFGMERDAISCRRCDAHLGHVFDDGPRPTGLRYCMNSVALHFVARALQVLASILLLSLAATGAAPVRAAEAAVVIPAPALDNPKTAGAAQTAVLAGGCFWGVQGVFQHVRGVRQVLSGYAGGAAFTAQYEIVSSGTTGHAESVQISFDPAEVSYGELLRIFFSVAHDPTQLDRQGPDTGTQYRSAIFYADESQRKIATAYIAQLNAAHVFPRAIATRLEPLKGFYAAEKYHQDFLTRNPTYPYIVYNDLPKVANLERLFPTAWRAQPVLVSAGAGSR